MLSPKRGWLSVNAADVLWDGRPVDPGDARDTFAEELVAFGDPPLSSDQADGKSTERQ